MTEGASFLVEQVLGDVPVRHWVLSLPHPLRYEPGEDPLAESDPGLAQLYQASVRGVLSLGPRAGERAVRFFGEAASDDPGIRRVSGGFNLHARQSIGAGDRAGLERLCRYLLRPPLAQKRLRILPDGSVYLGLKRAWGDGTQAFQFEPVEFLARLAALVPQPRGHTTRFHGVFAPNARLRDAVVPEVAKSEPEDCGHGDGTRGQEGGDSGGSQAGRMSWARLLKKVFQIDVLECPRCGSGMQRIAFVTAAASIRKILRAVGLPADSPEISPPKEAEDLFPLESAA